MSPARNTWILLIGLVALAQVGISAPVEQAPVRHASPEAEVVEMGSPASRWLSSAHGTQATTRSRLRVADQESCADASYVSYRRSDVQADVADQWYVASQLWADAELLRATAATRGSNGSVGAADDGPCHLAKGFQFLERLLDAGGYSARAAPDGSNVAGGLHYADDNAVAGLSLLAAADVERDPIPRERYLTAARSVAAFLTTSGLWDEMFGGGFWWNSNKGDRWEGKPAQSNALAALFFARLHAATGDATYGAWAVKTLAWLDDTLYDPSTRLYRWSVRYEDMKNRTGGPIFYSRYFNYDQAIALEAQILTAKIDGLIDRLDRAREIGRVMHAGLWNATHGGYNLEVGVDRIYASYGAWTSLGHLALYDLDGDPAWLDMAQRNANALDAMFRRADGGYGWRHFRCVTPIERNRPGCEGGESVWVVDQTHDGAAQAWMQHLQAAIAHRLSTRALDFAGCFRRTVC
jgi:hypothetical protein